MLQGVTAQQMWDKYVNIYAPGGYEPPDGEINEWLKMQPRGSAFAWGGIYGLFGLLEFELYSQISKS